MRIQFSIALSILLLSSNSCVPTLETLEENIPDIHQQAEQGNPKAQYQLGLMYLSGQGIQKDVKAAAKWYRKAAEQGNPEGQFGLGVLYFHGQGLPQDQQEAAKWYRKAAEQGNTDGQLGLGILYFMGKGVPQDDRQAYIWLSLAAAQGQKEAKEVSALAEQKLDHEALAEARMRVEAYYKKFVAPYQ